MIAKTFDEAYDIVKKLVLDFEEGSARYMRTDYKEQAVRVDFIDPFFEALGWDVNHKIQRDPFKREVEAERSEKEGRVDYSFHLAPDFKNPVFFVEAKKPSVDIKNELHYLQTIKYSWNAGLPISVLTDFQQFHILDCRGKAKAGDGSAFSGDHKEYHFTDFLDKEKFAEVYYLLSHEGVEAGNIQKYVDKLRKPKGKAIQTDLFKGGYRPIEEDFLAYIDELREELAKALKKNNEELDSEALTEATQRIIDRLVFIRFLEDKGILDGYYVSEFGTKSNTWLDFVSNCLKLNTEYNGVVFKKHFIDEKHFAGPDDKMFRDICRDICHLNSPYNFNYIPIHILGSIYEQFLGKVVHATDKRVKIEEKPEVRKAGGVYYTPKYIVEYIVENTIGKQIKDKTPKEIAKLRFADIACGSGSFLISVYEHLLDYHTIYYNKPDNIVQAQKDGCRKDEEGVWQLSIAQKQSILTNNVYGVDIDAQAVEVTQLSLYLKMLENENVVTVAKHLAKKGRLFGADKILPDLSNNIKNGNSLIEWDINQRNLLGNTLPDEELKALKPFDFKSEFKEVFKQGGFDSIVGNPPYVNLVSIPEIPRKYFQAKFKTCKNKSDLYSFFIEKVTHLLKPDAFKLGYIVPHTWLATDSFELLRKMLLTQKHIEQIVELGFNVFKDAIVSTVILIGSESNKKIKVLNKDFTERFEVNSQKWIDDNFFIDLSWNKAKEQVYDRMKQNTTPLENVIQFSRGIKTSDDNRFISDTAKNNDYKKIYRGKNIKAYQHNWNGEYVWYRPDLMREKVGCLPHSKSFFEVPEKLITQRVNSSMQLLVAYDNEQNYFLDTTNVSRYETWDKKHSLKFICGLLNSKLLNYWYCNKYKMPTIGGYELHSIPIRNIDFTNKTDRAHHDHIVSLVNQMLEGKKKLNEAKTDKDKEFYTRKCDALDKQIDDAVFELYGLTEEEKQIVLNS